MAKVPTLKFPCPPGCGIHGGAPITSITMRETGGADEMQAAGQVRAKLGNANFSDEMIRCAIVEVNEQPVMQPYLDYESWNSKLRHFALNVYKRMNEVKASEIEDFFAKAEAR